ncbi:NUDIX domain-containing protein [Parachitinimonas caeni]|uniref:NUDIX domain-containing protein n=1 Tax=Parachitinimonas caeni TaxID=3031301 RepID=A0ABT7E2I1_9NEIS|nr:NUDIX domain-containing protein [Parachitinimonas caeni]MDK2126529.1 NUDIX domain-containing protein [Parachitinimonas caeni]
MKANKVAPVVLRQHPDGPQILAFIHPLAGHQRVKGSLEPGEPSHYGAERELKEETGLAGRAVREIGQWDAAFQGQI